MRRLIVAATAGVALLLPFFAAAIDAEYPTGVRSMGMGNTGVADPNRASAVSLNIGAVSSLESYAAEAFTANRFGLIRANYLAGILPLSDRQAFGVDWLRADAGDSELDFSQNRVRLAYSMRALQRLNVGFGVNYRSQNASLDGSSLGRAVGWSADLGAVWTIPRLDRFRFGLSVRNWMSSTSGGDWRSGAWLRLEDGASQRVAPRARVWGVNYDRESLSAAVEWNEGLQVGAEKRFGTNFAARAGAVLPTRDGEGATWSLGGTARWRWGSVDYALVVPPELDATSYFGLSFDVSYRIPPVVVEAVAIKDLYVSLREHYARPELRAPVGYEAPAQFSGTSGERLGELWLYNPSDEAVRVSVRLWIDDYTSSRGTEAVEGVEIPAGDRRIVPLQKLLLSDEALNLRRSIPVEVRVEIADVRNPSRRRALTRTGVVLHGRNEMVLDDLRKLGVFISSVDPTIRGFAEQAVSTLEPDVFDVPVPSNLRKAAALFVSLRGVGYAGDPNLPHESGTIDAIKFPRELIASLREDSRQRPLGDCDDSSALVCSLFEAAGIPTALIQTPRHVLMAFEVGGLSLAEAQAREADAFVIGIDGNAWIPLETTLLSEGFAAAWKSGLKEGRASVVSSATTREAWERYGSVAPDLPYIPLPVDATKLNEWARKDNADEWLQLAIRAISVNP